MTSPARKILITGANGFVGSYIARKLSGAEGYQITCLVRDHADLTLISDLLPRVNVIRGDIRDVSLMYDTVKSMDCIIHAAAEVSFSAGRKSLISSAMDGTANLVNAALEAGTSKFVHISSVAAIGRRKPEERISEKEIFTHSKYDTDYGLAKFLAEQEVWRGNAEGLNTTILNPSMIIGAGMWEKTSLRVFAEIFQGLGYYPAGVNGWVDVRDVAEAAVRAMDPALNSKRFIISSENYSYREVFGWIAEGLGVKKPSSAIKQGLFLLVLMVDRIKSIIKGRKPLLSLASLRSTSASSYFENDRSRSELGVDYIPVQESVSQACRMFLDTFPKGKKYAIYS